MPQSGSILPVPSNQVVVTAVVTLFGLLLLAILLELFRRRAVKRRQIDREWRLIEQIVEEKQLSEEEANLLRALIRRWSPKEPIRAVTARHYFDLCVEEEMKVLAAQAGQEQMQRVGHTLRSIRTYLGLDYVPFGQRIQSTRELTPGQHLFVAPADQPQPRWLRLVVSTVDEASFTVVRHGNGEQEQPTFAPGDAVRCRMWREDDARYVFTVTLIRFEEGPPLWTFRHANELSRMQARGHCRVRYEQGTTVGVINAPLDDDLEGLRARPIAARLKGRITSLSAGGFALVLQQPLPKQVFLRVGIDLPQEPPLELHARIVQSAPISGERYLVRASFAGIRDEERDQIARYVLYRQRPHAAKDQQPE